MLASTHNKPLLKEYIFIACILVAAVVVGSYFYASRVHRSLNQSFIKQTNAESQLAALTFSRLLEDISNYKHFLGDKTFSLKEASFDEVDFLFGDTEVIDDGLRSIYSWLSIRWINNCRGDEFTSDDYKIYPVADAKKTPWELHIGALRQDPHLFIPTIMSIRKSDDDCIGSMLSRLYIDQIQRFMHRNLGDQTSEYVILDRSLNVLVTSGKDIELSISHRENIKNQMATPQPSSKIDPISIDDRQYISLYNIGTNFIVLGGYKEDDFYQYVHVPVRQDLFALWGFTLTFLIILYVIRKYVILPIIYGLNDDIEEHLQEKRKYERILHHVVSSVPGVVYRYKKANGCFRLEFISEQYQNLLGRDAPEMETDSDTTHWQYMDKEYEEQALQIIQQSDASYQLLYTVSLDNKKKRWLLEHGTKIIENGEVFYEGVILDTTALKQAEEETLKTLKALKKSNEELSQFTYILSHDLKEPLRIIAMYAQILQESATSHMVAKEKEYISFIRQSVSRIHHIIRNTLIYSGSNQVLRYDYVDMNKLVSKVSSILLPAYPEKTIKITHENLSSVYGDYDQLMQVIQNLISNAIKFNDKDACLITVRSTLDNDKFHISVEDNGIGIESLYHHEIFNLFYRLHTKDHYEGSGIGLALCKKIIESHGGHIWVTSQLGVGATFHFTLPVKKS